MEKKFEGIGYLYIFGCIIFTVYGQLIIKWRMKLKGALPEQLSQKLSFLFKAFLDPYILTGFFAALIASIFWMAVMTKFEISFAYPFMSLSFFMVLFLSALLLGETITIGKVVGLLVIIFGLIITVKY
jgi:undecaprenyl phosphate-alpha-L-ara4N flippase subunit ArnF